MRSLALFLICALPAQCWWETGHAVVARLAVARLTPGALLRASHILDVPDRVDAVADALALASNWADQVKKANNTGNWHFIDLALEDRKSDIALRCPDDTCITGRIRWFSSQLLKGDDLDALRYLVHFAGDIHQPLHDVSNADQGGNCEVLSPPIGRAKNLHALWDGELVNALGAGDREITADLEKEIDALSMRQQNEWAAGDPEDWAWEGHKLAEQDIYKRLKIPREPIEFPAACSEAPEAITELRLEISSGYIAAMQPVVRQQLEKAGLRLARLLNDSLQPL
jgi:S1/P1 Nuclease